MAEALSFEKVWAMFQETDRKFQETDRQFQETREQMKETDRKFQETDRKFQETREQMKDTDRRLKETDRIVKENAQQIGKLGNRFGEMVEHLVSPGIKNKFNELGFSFEQVSENIRISDAKGCSIAEIDLLLENGDTVMAVEVKAKPVQKDVDDHVNRMEILRSRADARNDKRRFQGAIAGAIMHEAVKNYAHKTGFYIIEQTGDAVRIAIPKGFKPREW